MLAVLTVVGIIAFLFIIPSREKKTAPTIHAQIEITKMESRLAETKRESEPVRLPEARVLNPSTAIVRYRVATRLRRR